MVANSKSAHHFFWPNIFLFILAGIWSPYYYEQETSFRKRAYRWYHRFAVTICAGYIVQSIVEFYRRYEEVSIDDKSEFYSFILQLMVGLLKIYFLDRNEARMRMMFLEIEEKPFQRNTDKVFDAMLRQRMKTNYKIMILFWVPIYTTVAIKLYTSTMDSVASVEMFNSVCFGEDFLASNGTMSVYKGIDCATYPKLVMPWITWFPFKTDTSPGHQIGIAYQILILTIFASYIFNFDMYVTSWMMYISFQLELVQHDLLTLREKSEDRVMTTNGSQDELLVTNEMIRGIRKIMNLHDDILRLFKHTQESLSVILIVQYFWISILICILMIQMSENKPTSSPFMSGGLYLFVAVNQIFVVFYYSNEVKLQSLKIPSAAFYCGWHLCGQYSAMLKSYVLFLIRCTNKEIRVLAGGVFDVDMVAFLKVMKASYSYFALVSSSNKK